MNHTQCPDCKLYSVFGHQPHLAGCSKPPPCPDCKGTGQLDTGIGPMPCSCMSPVPAAQAAVTKVVNELQAKLDAHPAAVQEGQAFHESPKMHALLARARIEDLKAKTTHATVHNAIDHALEAFDRYAEQEGLTA